MQPSPRAATPADPDDAPRARAAIRTWAVAALGALGLLLATDLGRAFTSEGARRLAIARAPRPLPAATLQDSTGARLRASELIGRRWVVGFVYTQCGSLCPRQTADMAELSRRLAERPELENVELLSVSFDPARDTPAALEAYRQHFASSDDRWRFARIEDRTELSGWLETFGIVVIPDGTGGFEHNAALHLVDPAGKLSAVHDLSDLPGVLAHLARPTP